MLARSMMQILVVDDDPTITRLVEAILGNRFEDQVRIKTVKDSKAAQQCLETEVIDLLITDLEMPGVNGLELLRSAKQRNAWTQVLLITGHSTRDSLTDAMELGATDYLLKPLGEIELTEAVAQAQRRLERWRGALAGTLTHREPSLASPSA